MTGQVKKTESKDLCTKCQKIHEYPDCFNGMVVATNDHVCTWDVLSCENFKPYE